jgi:hypothetical protein
MRLIAWTLWGTLAAFGAVALVVELMVGAGHAPPWGGRLQEMLGYVVVFTLWAIAGLGSLRETSVVVAGPAILWSNIPLYLGIFDRQLDVGPWKPAVRVGYAVSLLGAAFWGWLVTKRVVRLERERA